MVVKALGAVGLVTIEANVMKLTYKPVDAKETVAKRCELTQLSK